MGEIQRTKHAHNLEELQVDRYESLQSLVEEGQFHLRCYMGDERDLQPSVSEKDGGPVSQV